MTTQRKVGLLLVCAPVAALVVFLFVGLVALLVRGGEGFWVGLVALGFLLFLAGVVLLDAEER